MGMEIHAALTVLHTLNTIDQLFYIDLNNHLISFSPSHFVSRATVNLSYKLASSVNERNTPPNILIYRNNPCQFLTLLQQSLRIA